MVPLRVELSTRRASTDRSTIELRDLQRMTQDSNLHNLSVLAGFEPARFPIHISSKRLGTSKDATNLSETN